MRNRTPRRMNSALHGLGDVIQDNYVGDFATVFDAGQTGYTPLGVESQWATLSEGETTQDATVQAALLSPNPATRAAALNDAVATGKIAVAQTLPPSAFTAADVGKLIKVGAAVYQTMALRNAAGQTQYQPVQVNAGNSIPAPLLILAGLAAVLAFTG